MIRGPEKIKPPVVAYRGLGGVSSGCEHDETPLAYIVSPAIRVPSSPTDHAGLFAVRGTTVMGLPGLHLMYRLDQRRALIPARDGRKTGLWTPPRGEQARWHRTPRVPDNIAGHCSTGMSPGRNPGQMVHGGVLRDQKTNSSSIFTYPKAQMRLIPA